MISHSQQLAWRVLIYSSLVNGLLFRKKIHLFMEDMTVEDALAAREDRFTSGPRLSQCAFAYSIGDIEICYEAILTFLCQISLGT